MRLVIAKEPLRRILRWAQGVFLVSAISMVGYCAYVLLDTWQFQRVERLKLEKLLNNRIAFRAPRILPPTAAGGLIGRIEIRRLGLSVIVIEGSTKAALRHAAGHIPGTALPGQSGNIGISAHRDTFFRPLRNIQRSDVITLTTLAGEFRYRVVSTRIVDPNDVAVLESDGSEILTLVTCYPFYFLGAAPDRFIVRAERVI
jgi:sortase A